MTNITMKRKLWLNFMVLILAGCSGQPAYTAHYYENHKGALRRELARCQKANTLSGNAKKNCQTAAKVNEEEAMADFWGTAEEMAHCQTLSGNAKKKCETAANAAADAYIRSLR
jgi:hypothetical protein